MAPFLSDAGLGGEEEAKALCERFALASKDSAPAAAPSGGYLPAQALGSLCPKPVASMDVQEEKPALQPLGEAHVPAEKPGAGAGRRGGGAAARRAAQAAAEAALAPGAVLEFVSEAAADGAEVAKAFKSCVELRAWMQEASEHAAVLAASFQAYAEDQQPDALEAWSALLLNCMEEAGVAACLAEDESLSAVAQKASVQLVKHGLLRVRRKISEP